MKTLYFWAVLWLFIFSPLSAENKAPEENLKGFSVYVEQAMKEWKVPGLAISIVKDGEVIFAEGFGIRDVKKGLKTTPKTLFAIGSSSKAFTATAMGILADEGKLEWDKPVRTYLPSFKLQDPFASERMTPVDLICHNSGLPRHDSIWYGASTSREKLFHRLAYLEPSKDFRTTFQYNNLMFMTAGYLVGQVAGTTWESFVKDRIFTPLGMLDSNFSVNDSQKSPDYALPYMIKKDDVVGIPFRNIDNVGPAGSINSNVLDMAQWVLLNLNKGKAGDKQVVSEAALKRIHTPHMTMGGETFPGFEKYTEMLHSDYALGWMLTPYKGHLMIHHGGGIDGFTALVSFLPHDNLGMVVLSNLNGNTLPYFVTFNAYDRLLGKDQTPWDKRFKEILDKAKAEREKSQKEQDANRVPDTKPSHSLDDYVGEYENPGYGVFKVEKAGDQLKAEYNSTSGILTHFHYDMFKLKDEMFERNMMVTFLMDLKGQIFRLLIPLEPNVKAIEFTRMPEKKMKERAFLEQFVGEYELQGLALMISIKGENTLVASVPGQGEIELIPYRGMEFNLKNLAGFSIEFVVDASGTVTSAKVTQPNGVFTATKKK